MDYTIYTCYSLPSLAPATNFSLLLDELKSIGKKLELASSVGYIIPQTL